MKEFIIALFSSFFLLFSCNNQTQNNPKIPPAADSAADTAKAPAALQEDVNTSSLNFINDWKGKTATEAGMFDNSTIDNRLIKMLGEKEYSEMKNNWNVQTPFIEEDGILSASGCKVHDCPSYHTIIYVDVASNNINIQIIKNKNSKAYTEKGIITLPAQMQKDLEASKK
ncbi:MAG: hypothetical protein ABI172_10645 [Ginsengibacter sp.]